MPRAAETANGVGSPASESQLHATLVSHLNTQVPLEQAESSIAPIPAKKKTAMEETTPASSPLSSVPYSPLLLVKGNESQLSAESKTNTHEQSVPETHGNRITVSSTATLSDAPPVTALEISKDQVAKQPFKRTREGDAIEEDAQPRPKKPATEADVGPVQTSPAETVAPKQITVDCDDGTSSAEELAKPKTSNDNSKQKRKTAPKTNAAASRRGRACDTCKRRKVKCKHMVVEESPNDEVNPTADASPDGAADKEETAAKSTETIKTQAAAQADDPNDYDAPNEAEPPKQSKAKKKPAPKQTRAPPERTSTRTRKAPERFEDGQELPPAQASSQKKGPSRVFDPIYITTNSTSRLGKADVYHMLLEDAAWSSLSAAQQETLVSMLPHSADNQRLLAKIRAGEEDTRPQWLKASAVFRDEVAKFKHDLTNGHLGKTWQAAAELAVVERARGEYDAWKAEEAELWWGQKSK